MDEYLIDFDKGLVEEGSEERTELIKNVMRKANAGEPVTIGFLGGSITQGSVATDDTLCYAYRVYEWFKKRFPESDVSYVNAGIGATDSEFAAARVAGDLLSAHPDFVLMEFSVNDECSDHMMECYEGTLRQILKSKADIGVMLMSNVFYSEGMSTERIHRMVARHYGVPVVSMRSTIYEAILKGRFPKEKITPDDLHPNDEGHALVAEVILTYLRSLDPSLDLAGEEVNVLKGDLALPAPLTPNRYENSVKYDNRNSSEVLVSMQGFVPDTVPQKMVRDCFRNGYATKTGDSYAEYEVTGSCIAVQYRRTIDLPAPVAKVTVDGDESSAVILDANFEATWGDKLELTDIYISDAPAKHKVRIEITKVPEGCRGDFYLAGVIVSS